MAVAARSHALVLALENAIYTPPFFFLVLIFALLTGAWLGLLIAFTVAAAASVGYQLLINTLNPVPSKAAVLSPLTHLSTAYLTTSIPQLTCPTHYSLRSHRMFNRLRSWSVDQIARLLSLPITAPLCLTCPLRSLRCASVAEAAVRLSQMGFLVFATVRSEDDLRLLQSHTLPNIHPLHLDVSSQPSREAALKAVQSRLIDSGHRLLGLVHNAGYAVSSPLELVPLDEARQEYETNVFGLIHLTQLFLPLLRAANLPPHTARIVIVSSSLGTATIAGGATYSSTKHAVEAIGDGFRMELAAWKIGVCMVEPGSHATPFHPKADATQAQNMERAHKEAMQRCGQEVLAKYQQMSKRAWAPPPSPAKQPIGVVVDAIVTGLLAKYAPDRIKAGMDSAMGGVMGAFPAFMVDKFMGKGYV